MLEDILKILWNVTDASSKFATSIVDFQITEPVIVTLLGLPAEPGLGYTPQILIPLTCFLLDPVKVRLPLNGC